MYKGREGQWAFMLHRISGMIILLYLMVHVMSIGAMTFGEGSYMRIHNVYDRWFYRIGLLGIVGAVVYHAFNGLRIIIMDFTGIGVSYQRQMWYAALALAVLAVLYAAFRLYPRLMGGY